MTATAGQGWPECLTEETIMKKKDKQVRRRNRRLPVQASLHLDDSLAANEHHPLASSAPETRAAGRLRLIASVLARLARGCARRG